MTSKWFPVGKNNSDGWRLDIVSLLAVIGESAMEEHAQTLTSSWTCILPRIIPAPQALLKPARPARMPQVPATIVGVHNGTKVDRLNYFPNIIHPIEDLPSYSFKVYSIKHKILTGEQLASTSQLGLGAQNRKQLDDEERQGQININGQDIADLKPLQRGCTRASTFNERVTGNTSEKKPESKQNSTTVKLKPHVPTANFSPLNMIAVFSCLLTTGLVIWAIIIEDGTAIVALGTISLMSSLVGLASWWQPALMPRNSRSKVPPGDVVIRTHEAAFIVVFCDEDVARELYTGAMECDYWIKNRNVYRGLVGMGTFLLMISVILLGNCNWTMQAAIGVAYVLLNGAYWLTSLMEKKQFWNLDSYVCEPIEKDDYKAAESTDTPETGPPSYTRTLWYAIRETKQTAWVLNGDAAPTTQKWKKWLQEAESNAKNGRRNWNAVQRKDEIIGITDPEEQTRILQHEEQERLIPQSAPVSTAPLPETL